MRPFAHAGGNDLPRPFDELVSRLAAESDDFLVGFEAAVREPVVAAELPYVLDHVQLQRAGWQRQERGVAGDVQLRRHVPSGLIQDHQGVGISPHGAANLGLGTAPTPGRSSIPRVPPPRR